MSWWQAWWSVGTAGSPCLAGAGIRTRRGARENLVGMGFDPPSVLHSGVATVECSGLIQVLDAQETHRMRLITVLLLSLALAPLGAIAQQGPAVRTPFVVEQTYWIKPGKELQFVSLFEKNRVPPLQAKVKEGGVLWMRLARPQFNAANEQWDLRVTVAWRDAGSAMEQISKAKSQLAKDTPRLAMEQQIMEELVLERTDVPVQEWGVDSLGP